MTRDVVSPKTRAACNRRKWPRSMLGAARARLAHMTIFKRPGPRSRSPPPSSSQRASTCSRLAPPRSDGWCGPVKAWSPSTGPASRSAADRGIVDAGGLGPCEADRHGGQAARGPGRAHRPRGSARRGRRAGLQSARGDRRGYRRAASGARRRRAARAGVQAARVSGIEYRRRVAVRLLHRPRHAARRGCQARAPAERRVGGPGQRLRGEVLRPRRIRRGGPPRGADQATIRACTSSFRHQRRSASRSRSRSP